MNCCSWIHADTRSLVVCAHCAFIQRPRLTRLTRDLPRPGCGSTLSVAGQNPPLATENLLENIDAGGSGALVQAPHHCSLGAAPCCSYLLFMPTRAILMPSLFLQATAKTTMISRTGFRLTMVGKVRDRPFSVTCATPIPLQLDRCSCSN